MFFNPKVQKINGLTLGSTVNSKYTPNEIELGIEHIKGFDDKVFGTFDTTNYEQDDYSILDHLTLFKAWKEGVDSFRANIGTSVVSSIKAPSNTKTRNGAVDLTPDFALYLPLAGGTMTGDLDFSLNNGERQHNITNLNTISTNYATIEEYLTVNNDLSVGGSVVLSGDLTVHGTTTIVNTTNLEISDNVITIAKGNTAALTKPAGIVVPNYDGSNEHSGALFFDANGIAWVGDVVLDSEGQILISNAKTTALPLAVVDKTLVNQNNAYEFPDQISKFVYDKNIKAYKLVNSGFTIKSLSDYDEIQDDRDKAVTVVPFSEIEKKMGSSIAIEEVNDGASAGATTKLILKDRNGNEISSLTAGSAFSSSLTTAFNWTSAVSGSDRDTTIPSISAVAKGIKNYSNRVYLQTTAPTDTQDTPLSKGDVWIDISE